MKKRKKYAINKFVEQIRQFKKEVEQDFIKNYLPNDYWGMCPKCFKVGEKSEGLTLNIGRNHFMCCDKHKTFWYFASNLFSCWKEQNEEDWQSNYELLSRYTEVKPVHISDLFNFFEIENLKRENADLKKTLQEMTGKDIDAGSRVARDE
jgi:hypothetical protein